MITFSRMPSPILARAAAAASLFLAVTLGCQASGSPKASAKPSAGGAPSQETSMASSNTVHPDVLKRFCGQPPGPAPVIVKVLKDSAGRIGGYMHTIQIMDSPIYYLDAQGRDYAMFHIFGSDEEKAKNKPLIDKLRAAYPLEEPLACP